MLGQHTSGQELAQILEILHPHSNIKELQFSGYTGDFWPSWFQPVNLPNLKSLKFEECCNIPGITFSALPCTGFQFLEVLEILYCPSISWQKGFVLPSSLRRLSLVNCGDVSEWVPACLVNLTSLVHLQLIGLFGIISIPGDIWRNSLQFLDYLGIYDCEGLLSIGEPEAIAQINNVDIDKCPMLNGLEQPFWRGDIGFLVRDVNQVVQDLPRTQRMEDNGWSLPTAIGGVVGRLRFYLGNSGDPHKYKGTMKMLDLLEEKLKLLYEENLQRVNIDREEEMAAWLRQVKEATDDAEELVKDMEAEVEAGESAISDVMAWFYSDSSNLLRMKYTIGKLVSVCAEGESILDAPNLDEDRLESVRNDSTSLSPDHAFVVGRDEEIAMILGMILDDACFVAATSLESRASADRLQISQKGWIIEILRNIDLSKHSQEAPEVAPYQKEMGSSVEYTRVCNNTGSKMWNPTIIPIVGMGGVGKTTLAQFIFNDKRVQKRFQGQSAWVYFTNNIRKEELMTQVLVSLQPQHNILSRVLNLNNLHIQLQSIIEGKRFLLVLDDVSDEIRAIWGDMSSVLCKGAPGSVVLVTTQLYSVASFVGTTTPIFLDSLQCDDLWKLFKHHAFASKQSTEALEPIGRKIADKLHGFPLAAVTIGASLRNYLDEAHWERLLKSWWWNISNNSLGIHIISSLGICYCELPAYLRQCLVYCSIFPRNYVFQKYELIQMWIANGFVGLDNSTGPRRLEDVAGEWFDELVDKCFLQPTVWKVRYIMHDLVRDFTIALTSSEYHGVDYTLGDLPQSVRHLSINMDNNHNMNLPWTAYNVKQLRSLILFGGFRHTNSSEGCNTVDSILESSYDTVDSFSESSYDPIAVILKRSCETIDSIVKSSTSLHLLNLSNMRANAATACIGDHLFQGDFIALFVNWITRYDMLPRLIHLRYLDFSYSGITKIPDSLCGLCNLQVLGLRGCRFTQLPRNMNSLMNLRHLHADPDTSAQVYGIGKLTKLQELNEFRVKAENGHRITELSDLNDIGGFLCISSLGMLNDPGEALQANIVGKNHLTNLRLEWCGDLPKAISPDLTMEILGNLSPPRNLQELELFGYPGFAFPDWVGQLKHVRAVEISSCEKLQVLPPLGQLEHLQKLRLHKLPLIKGINSEVCGTANVVFRSLEELNFEDMHNCKSWTYAGGREFIPNLQKLRIFQCPELREVPCDALGSATKEIFLRECNPNSITRYLQRLTGLTHLEMHVRWSGSGILTLQCEQLASLEYLNIKCSRTVCIKGGLWYLRKLKDLRITCTVATELDEESLHEEKHVPTQSARVMRSLTHLTVGGSTLSTGLNNVISISGTPSLRTLCIESIRCFTSITEQWLQQLTSLQEMELFECDRLPSSLVALSSLKKLAMKNCYNICSIPPNSLPGNLKELQTENCSTVLEARCQKRNGEIWGPKEEIKKSWRGKMRKWYGQRKLFEMQWKQQPMEMGKVSYSKIEEPLKSAEELMLVEEDKWLQQSDENEWPGEGWKGEEWCLKKLLELRGEDWPNIVHVPYIRINGEIIQNLYT